MNEQSYLIFELAHSRYGIPTAVVEELFLLPDMVSIPEAPTYTIGLVNVRGEILPIIDLNQRLGQASPPYQLTDSIIVLQWQSQRLGVLVNRVCEVETIAPHQYQFQPHIEAERSPNSSSQSLIKGIASLDADLIILLNPEALVQSISQLLVSQQAREYSPLNGNQKFSARNGLSVGSVDAFPPATELFSHLPTEARQILQARANNLRQPIDIQDVVGMPVAVVELGGEYLGMSLETVHEFIDVRKVTPVPCCPPHILGNINLRGEIVTLVDISQIVNVSGGSPKPRKKAIVVRQEQLTAGIVVDQIFDLIYLNAEQISTPPVAIHTTHDDCLQGVSVYRDKMMSIINLSRILEMDALVVNEDV